MKRIVVIFNHEAIQYAKKYGFNKALKASREKENAFWEVEEYTFTSKDELKGFVKGLSIAAKLTLDEPVWKEVRKSPKKKKKK